MKNALGQQLYACGRKGMPEKIEFGNNEYRLREVLKHDFFAATGLYELKRRPSSVEAPPPAKIVLKLSRHHNILGLPMLWLGEFLCCHEISVLHRLRHLRGIPRLLSRYGRTGFIYEYIEGCPLNRNKDLPQDFFDKLLELLRQVHQRKIVYLDMNKRSNIIVGSDGESYLIDFQIAVHIGEHMLFWRSAYLWDVLQKADIYHLFKHKRRLCPELLRPEETPLSYCTSGLIRLHRMAATPLRRLRRWSLVYLHAKDLIADGRQNSAADCEK
jgi:serine/threonine protein kinase